MIDLIAKLTAIPGPGGNEDEIARAILEEVKNLGVPVKRDSVGNLIICGTDFRSESPNVVIVAHMDEVFGVVRYIDDAGFLYMQAAPGLSLRDVYGKTVMVRTFDGWIYGKVGAIPNHLTRPSQETTFPTKDGLCIDVGCSTKKEVNSLGVYIGSPIVFKREFFTFKNTVFATALDNRAGIAVALRLLKTMGLPSHVAYVFSVQEEFSLRGCLPALQSLKPDVVICVDGAIATDTPEVQKISDCPLCDIRLGGGPVFTVYNFQGKGEVAGIVRGPPLVRLILDMAKMRTLSVQFGVTEGIVSEAAYAQWLGEGIFALEASFPLRYAHTGVEACNLGDLTQLQEFVALLIEPSNLVKIKQMINMNS